MKCFKTNIPLSTHRVSMCMGPTYTQFSEFLDLVLDEGDGWRDHHSDSSKQAGWKLVAQAFTSTWCIERMSLWELCVIVSLRVSMCLYWIMQSAVPTITTNNKDIFFQNCGINCFKLIDPKLMKTKNVVEHPQHLWRVGEVEASEALVRRVSGHFSVGQKLK